MSAFNVSSLTLTAILAIGSAPVQAEKATNGVSAADQTIKTSRTPSIREMELSGTAASGRGYAGAIPKTVWKAMQGKSWHGNLPCPAYDELSYLTVPYWNFEGKRREGHMIVAQDVAEDVLKAFALIFKARFRIHSMRPVHEFGGNDGRSMAANNTSAFNCRYKTSKPQLSEHSYGRAIDINPVQNPYVTRRRIVPPAGRNYNSHQERAVARRGLIQDDGPVVAAFLSIRWRWGGSWRHAKDYQHFSQSGR